MSRTVSRPASLRLGLVRWTPPTLVILSALLVAQPASAQDCTIGRDGWDDIQRFRRCIEEHGLTAWTPWVLHQAAQFTSNPTIVRLLLQAGADPNAKDEWGFTPLHFAAAFNDDPDIVSALVDAGANLNARDKEWGASPLHWAAWSNDNPGIIIALLDGGADPNSRDSRDSTPLHAAADQSNNPEIILTLLDSGADLTLRDAGKLAWDYIKDNETLKDSDAYVRLGE